MTLHIGFGTGGDLDKLDEDLRISRRGVTLQISERKF
jgi:hypothetical protein